MADIAIGASVGRNGRNQPIDVVAIGAALVQIGPTRGGVSAPPTTIKALGDAIFAFQTAQKLPARDGRIDPNGNTLRRINQLLNSGVPPTPVVPPTGEIRPLDNVYDLPTSIAATAWTPVATSLASEWVFRWESMYGGGKLYYFHLDENVVPKWFGVLVPDGTGSFDQPHIFFHPTPSQAGYDDGKYQGLGNFWKIFHYLSDSMGHQFCGAGTGRVLVMPLLTTSAAQTCGMFPQRWERLVSTILTLVQAAETGRSTPVVIHDVVVSSFSSGITYSHHFRRAGGLGPRLAGVIDFDGSFSSYRQHSAAITAPPGKVVRMAQMPANPKTLTALAAQNIFPLPRPRWAPDPFGNLLPKHEGQAALHIHARIPQTMMYLAARRIG